MGNIYKKNKIDVSDESKIITSMIISSDFIKNIKEFCETSLLEIKMSKIVCQWCLDYYKKYNSAPKKTIKDIYENEKEELDEDTADLIHEFLVTLNNNYDDKNYNVDYEVDRAERFFRLKKLKRATEQLNGAIAAGKPDEAENIMKDFRRAKIIRSTGVDVFSDNNSMANVFFSEDDDYLLKFPGDLGKMLGGWNREDLIAVVAPPKRGKSWWMQEIAILAIMQGLKVLFVSLEMPEKQVLRRIYMRILSETKGGKEAEVQVPYFDDYGNIKQKTSFKKGIKHNRTKKKLKSIKNMVKNSGFRVVCYPAYSLDIDEFSDVIDNLEYYDDFVPDVIICDYFDIFRTSKKADHRNQIDYIWKIGRSIAQIKHLLFVTGTHSNRGTFNRDIEEGDITEDIRKLNHVAAMFALNQTPDEKKQGIMRVKSLINRHDDFDTTEEVVVLQQLKIGRPYLDSKWKSEVIL